MLLEQAISPLLCDAELYLTHVPGAAQESRHAPCNCDLTWGILLTVEDKADWTHARSQFTKELRHILLGETARHRAQVVGGQAMKKWSKLVQVKGLSWIPVKNKVNFSTNLSTYLDFKTFFWGGVGFGVIYTILLRSDNLLWSSRSL